MDELQLTSSSSYLGVMAVVGQDVTISSIPTGVTKVRFVEVSYPENGDRSKPVITKIVERDVVSGSATYAGSSDTTILAYGLIPTSGAAKVSLDNMGVDPDEPFIAQVNLERLVASGNIAVTETLGTNL